MLEYVNRATRRSSLQPVKDGDRLVTSREASPPALDVLESLKVYGTLAWERRPSSQTLDRFNSEAAHEVIRKLKHQNGPWRMLKEG
ncbi:hypothetical protein Acr_11g0009500 [Actinidia rufa]|uniref:Uncharacterized protein n=1 Tax=Actinidia rufa TaxID=165716 RepID=A0A7J0FD64_9ERIC|nr:hypothetical protein Acr_11g0009500 [Actinidia rufa]